MNVLAIGCHPDDMEINCAGTLAKCVARGDKVTVCHVANGNLGHVIIQPDELREIRRNEAIKAGSLAGIEVVTCDIGDLVVYEGSREQRDKVVDIIRSTKPCAVLIETVFIDNAFDLTRIKTTEGQRKCGEAIAKATAEGAFSLIGGGDSVACVNKFGLADQVSYISTGGGALLEAIEGKVLPGVAAVKG